MMREYWQTKRKRRKSKSGIGEDRNEKEFFPFFVFILYSMLKGGPEIKRSWSNPL